MNPTKVRREDLISRQEAAKQLGVHPNTLDRWADAAGMTKYRQLGSNRLFFLKDDIDNCVVTMEVAP